MSRPIVNAVYYPSWEVYKGKPPSSLNADVITHVLYAFLRINEDGSLRLLDQFGDLHKNVDGEKGCLAALRKFKRQNPHIKFLISVGGGSGSDEFPKLAASNSSRTRFARQLRKFCDDYGFDGVDIDWEHPRTAIYGVDYVALLESARNSLPSPRYLLTTALPVGEYCLNKINLEHAARLLDFLNLMCYDFAADWTDVSGHHSQLWTPPEHIGQPSSVLSKSCSKGVEYVLSANVASHKILLGIPAFARYFPRAQEPGQTSQGAGEMDYSALPDHWVREAYINETAGAAYYLDVAGDKGFVSFDVPRTVVSKARYAKETQLGGLFYWTGTSDRTGNESLVVSGHNELMATVGSGAMASSLAHASGAYLSN